MAKSKWTPPKYNRTELKHRQRLLMLICLCIGADLLIGILLCEMELSTLISAVLSFVLAVVSLNDPIQDNAGNLRIAGFVLILLGAIVKLTISFSWFWIVGLFQFLGLALFAAWPYRKRILHAIGK